MPGFRALSSRATSMAPGKLFTLKWKGSNQLSLYGWSPTARNCAAMYSAARLSPAFT